MVDSMWAFLSRSRQRWHRYSCAFCISFEGKPVPEPQVEQVEAVYTDEHRTRFQERGKRLSMMALCSSHISKTKRSDVHEIVVPVESTSELIAEAMKRFK
jgi:hypothetical protein